MGRNHFLFFLDEGDVFFWSRTCILFVIIVSTHRKLLQFIFLNLHVHNHVKIYVYILYIYMHS